MPITNFPPEINFIVFQYLPRVTLYECLFVCKSWSLAAVQLYYSEIILSNNLHKLLPGLLYGRDIGKWVRKLKIYQIYSNQRPLSEQEFIALVSRMPFLKQIDLNCFNTVSHLKALWEMDANLLGSVNEISVRNSCPNSGSLQLYTLINLKLCNTITHLRLENFHTEYFKADKQIVMAYLSKFTSLEYLKIINDTRNGLADLDMISIFGACPNLRTLDLRSYLPASNNRSNNCTKTPLSIGINSNTIPMNTKLQNLTLGIPDLTVPYSQYITRHTPANLISFKLYTYYASFSDWVENSHRFEQLKLFAKHIRTYRNMKINMESSLTRYINQPLAGELLKKSVTSLWDFMYLVKGDRDLFCNVVLYVDNFRLNHLKPYIYVQNDAILNIRSSISYSHNWNSNDQQYHWDSYFQLNLPGATKGLPFIHSLVIDYTLFYSMTMEGIEQLVQCLFSRCHWLQSLFLETNTSSLAFGPDTSLCQNESFSANYRKLITRPYTWTQSTTQDNLRFISLDNILVSTRLLEIITTALPNIQTLKLSRCSFKCFSMGSNVIKILLDKINHLPRFEFVLPDFSQEKWQRFCVVFEPMQGIALLYEYAKHSFQPKMVQMPFNLQKQSAVLHVQCARIDTICLSGLDDTKSSCITLYPWNDFNSMSNQRESWS